MAYLTATRSSRQRWAPLFIGLALLFLVLLLCGLQAMSLAYADPDTLYVDGAAGNDNSTCGAATAPCETISYAINTRASDGDTILISEGTYNENLAVAGITVTLRGGYTIAGTTWLPDSGQTVIDGNNLDRTIVVQGNNSVLENLTITGGQTPPDQCWGGGVWVSNGNVTIRSSLITNNVADCSGGGIEVNNDLGPAHLTIEDSVISNNLSKHHGGGLVVWDSSAELLRTTVMGNAADGGVNGFGGGISVYNGASLSIVNSMIKSNYARLHAGGIETQGSSLGITNTLVVGNIAANINVLAIDNSAVTIQNSTIADNNPEGAQAILAMDPAASSLIIRNSVMWNNALSIQWDGPKNNVSVTYSDIYDPEGWWAGTGNITFDPLFAGEGDYHLQANSPCIDAGTPTGAPLTDIEGSSRDALPDMGAYEGKRARLYLPFTLNNFGP